MPNKLQDQLIDLGEKLSKGYESHHGEVLLMISDARKELISRFGMIAPWESEELDLAENYVGANFLKASLLAVYTSLVVSEYLDEEYWVGYGYTHKYLKKVPRRV